MTNRQNNEIEKAQKILEGKCVECDVLLPEHNRECPLHPRRKSLDILDRIQQGISNMNATVLRYARKDPELFNKILQNIKDRKNKDV
jgi:hypothetical protein